MISCVTSSITISVYFGVKLNGHNYGDVKNLLTLWCISQYVTPFYHLSDYMFAVQTLL